MYTEETTCLVLVYYMDLVPLGWLPSVQPSIPIDFHMLSTHQHCFLETLHKQGTFLRIVKVRFDDQTRQQNGVYRSPQFQWLFNVSCPAPGTISLTPQQKGPILASAQHPLILGSCPLVYKETRMKTMRNFAGEQEKRAGFPPIFWEISAWVRACRTFYCQATWRGISNALQIVSVSSMFEAHQVSPHWKTQWISL